jgi:hypothetical protein
MRDWIAAYPKGDFDALKAKQRADAASAGKLPQEVIGRLVAYKDEHPLFTVPMVIDAVRVEMRPELQPKSSSPLPHSSRAASACRGSAGRSLHRRRDLERPRVVSSPPFRPVDLAAVETRPRGASDTDARKCQRRSACEDWRSK